MINKLKIAKCNKENIEGEDSGLGQLLPTPDRVVLTLSGLVALALAA